MPHAGQLRAKVGFFQRPAGRDPYGNSRGEFPAEPEFEVRASVQAKFSGEAVQASRLAGRQVATITVRRNALTAAVDPTWRIKDMIDGTIWEIKSGPVDPDGGRAWLEFLCQSGVAG